ncbi:hypothetical protein NKDENANG_01757 [Candidatus Entotheonellaceae bacterium PAL068K]
MSHELTSMHKRHEPVEVYAGGEIRAHHGGVNRWLLLVYAILFVWSLYYLFGPFEGLTPTFAYWGELGPGLAEAGNTAGAMGAMAFWVMALGVLVFFGWVAALAWKK